MRASILLLTFLLTITVTFAQYPENITTIDCNPNGLTTFSEIYLKEPLLKI